MKDFMLDENGELVFHKGKIPLVSDKQLKAQKARQVLRTQIGEWEYDKEEGINRYSMLTKNPNDEEIEDNIRSGLLQIDDDFRLTKYSRKDQKDRHSEIFVSATDGADEEYNFEL